MSRVHGRGALVGLALAMLSGFAACGADEGLDSGGSDPAAETVEARLSVIACNGSAGPGEVVFFANAGFSGTCWKAAIGASNDIGEVPWVGDVGISNDVVTGVQLGPNMYLIAYDNAHFGGKYVEADNYGNGGARNVDVGSINGFNDKMSSFKISSSPFPRPSPPAPSTGAVLGQLWNPYYGTGVCGETRFQITNASGSAVVAPNSPLVSGRVVSDGGRQKCLWQYTWWSVPVQDVRVYGQFGGRWFFNSGTVRGGQTITVDINRHL